MNVTIVKREAMKVIGFQREFSMDDSYIQIPKFWDEIMALPSETVAGYRIGEYGICIDELPGNRFHYMIAGEYTGGDIPQGMRIYELPAGDYAIFSCTGPLPQTLQEVNTQVFTQWLPGNPDYELSRPANVEWYDYDRNPQDPDYHSAIWLPVQKK